MQTDPPKRPTADELGAALTEKELLFVEHSFACGLNTSVPPRTPGYPQLACLRHDPHRCRRTEGGHQVACR